MWINLHTVNFVTDQVRINEQDKCIATESIYACTKFEAILTLLPDDVVVLNYRNVTTTKLYFRI